MRTMTALLVTSLGLAGFSAGCENDGYSSSRHSSDPVVRWDLVDEEAEAQMAGAEIDHETGQYRTPANTNRDDTPTTRPVAAPQANK